MFGQCITLILLWVFPFNILYPYYVSLILVWRTYIYQLQIPNKISLLLPHTYLYNTLGIRKWANWLILANNSHKEKCVGCSNEKFVSPSSYIFIWKNVLYVLDFYMYHNWYFVFLIKRLGYWNLKDTSQIMLRGYKYCLCVNKV